MFVCVCADECRHLHGSHVEVRRQSSAFTVWNTVPMFSQLETLGYLTHELPARDAYVCLYQFIGGLGLQRHTWHYWVLEVTQVLMLYPLSHLPATCNNNNVTL